MSQRHAAAATRAARIIKARPEELYAAFMDPAALVAWLPPAEMTGQIHAFDARSEADIGCQLITQSSQI
jgi:uncharacterized protein YndB with AHSA1/START domain